MVRFYGVFETSLRDTYGFVGRETVHERTHSFACALQLCVAYVTLAAVDVRKRKDERLRGRGGFLLGLGQRLLGLRTCVFCFHQGVRRAHVADRKRGHKRHEQERGGDDSKRGEGIAPRKKPKTT